MKPLQSAKRSVVLPLVAAATTQRTANIDCQGADYLTVVLQLGTRLNTNATQPTIRLLESNSTTATTFATFNASFQRSCDNSNASGVVGALNLDLRGRGRYIRIELNPDTTTNGPIISGAVSELRLDNENALNSANADFVVVG